LLGCDIFTDPRGRFGQASAPHPTEKIMLVVTTENIAGHQVTEILFTIDTQPRIEVL
jgi:hypothetical protein